MKAAEAAPGRRRVVVIDDDPTGTQASAGVPILLDPLASLVPLLRRHQALHVLSNSRALSQAEAVDLVAGIAARAGAAASEAGWELELVLRGDTTLRGHVLAESDALGAAPGVLLFVPGYPQIGRYTTDGRQLVDIGGRTLNAADTEFAAGPQFRYSARTMRDWVAEHAAAAGLAPRPVTAVGLAAVRAGSLADIVCEAAAGSVVVPDVATPGDLEHVSAAVTGARRRGARLVLRCSAALAALRTGCLAPAAAVADRPAAEPAALVVCGSHTAAATAQLDMLAAACGAPVRTVSTAAALADPGEAASAAAAVLADLTRRHVAILATQRQRPADHDSAAHGQAVMTALQQAVTRVAASAGLTAVIAKGGITSAETARTGLGASSAMVRGPLLPGVALWEVAGRSRVPVSYAVVPGNVGGPDTMVRVAAALGIPVSPPARQAAAPEASP